MRSVYSLSMITPKHVIISRTDSIGDVILTLPMAGILKATFPDIKITFLGRTYTQPVVARCSHVDAFADIDQTDGSVEQIATLLSDIDADCIVHVFPNRAIARAALKAGVQHRIGTIRKIMHLGLVNHKLNFTRKKSQLHEAQLNVKMLEPFGVSSIPELHELHGYLGWENAQCTDELIAQASADRINLVFHPKSKGSAVEWPLAHYQQLIQLLPPSWFRVFITGTEDEGQMIKSKTNLEGAIDLTGKLSLEELIGFLGHCDGILAASTGPLHIASVSGAKTFGVFSNRRPIHPGRWQPIGPHTHIVSPSEKATTPEYEDKLVENITPEQLLLVLLEAFQVDAAADQ